ncbi:putative invertase inhibitor [Momordica charantia]|uniref:Invertase inhibitor n=1 Tax=Momordica charantia TaxID=3673 RepID=A0A6J1DR96_MOMCH|nr:putative invertase inhibitor [Momordica charantia]
MSPLSPFIIFFFVFLSTLPTLTQPYNNSNSISSLIYKTCKISSLQDPNISFNFCLTSLQSAAHAHQADLRHLGLLSLRLLRRNVTTTRRHIKKLLRRKSNKIRLDPFIKSCLDDCLELYSDDIPTLKRARRDYRAGRYAEANSEISSVMDDSVTCEDGFKEEEGVVSPLTSRNHNAFELSAIALSIINMLA